MELEEQLEDKKVQISVTSSARKWLARHGYDANMGARPMARLIQAQIKQPLADELLFGRLKQGGCVTIFTKENELQLTIKTHEQQRNLSRA
jgi:ATP-dependent Clp protease ATP-binding subunit ClpA